MAGRPSGRDSIPHIPRNEDKHATGLRDRSTRDNPASSNPAKLIPLGDL